MMRNAKQGNDLKVFQFSVPDVGCFFPFYFQFCKKSFINETRFHLSFVIAATLGT